MMWHALRLAGVRQPVLGYGRLLTLNLSSSSPNTNCGAVKPASLNSPRGVNSPAQWRANSPEARTERPNWLVSFSMRAAQLTAGPMQVKSRRLPLPILP